MSSIYDELNAIPEENIIKFLAEKANELEPVHGEPSFDEQARRLQTYPFTLLYLAKRLQSVINRKDNRIEEIRNELIEVRKELSKLKRNK